MTKWRIWLILLGVSALVASFASFAQKSNSSQYLIGVLSAESLSDPSEKMRLAALQTGLRDLGYGEGRNFTFVSRWAEGRYDQLPALAGELVRMNPKVVVTMGIKATIAAQKATTSIPIVVPATGSDLVSMGLATSLARPGGNVTGSAAFGTEIMVKRMEVLKDIMPRVTRIGVLLNPSNPQFHSVSASMSSAAKTLKMSLEIIKVSTQLEIEKIARELSKSRIDAVIVWEDTLLAANDKLIAGLLLNSHIPSIGGKDYAEAGGSLGYGVDRIKLFRQAAVYIDKILKGAKPGDLPIERATTFEFVVNNQTIKKLGLTIPQTVLVRATRVIE